MFNIAKTNRRGYYFYVSIILFQTFVTPAILINANLFCPGLDLIGPDTDKKANSCGHVRNPPSRKAKIVFLRTPIKKVFFYINVLYAYQRMQSGRKHMILKKNLLPTIPRLVFSCVDDFNFT